MANIQVSVETVSVDGESTRFSFNVPIKDLTAQDQADTVVVALKVDTPNKTRTAEISFKNSTPAKIDAETNTSISDVSLHASRSPKRIKGVEGTCQVFIKTMTMTGQATIQMNLSKPLKEALHAWCDSQGVPPDRVRFLFAGKQLQLHRTALEYGIMENATIYMVHALRGS